MTAGIQAGIQAGIHERALGPDDVGAAAALNAAVGWNQVAADWRMMLAHGHAFGLVPNDPARGPALVATALTVTLGERLAWISMVLVDPGWRRQGFGTRLLKRCIAALAETGV